jgi:hypothetical protein
MPGHELFLRCDQIRCTTPGKGARLYRKLTFQKDTLEKDQHIDAVLSHWADYPLLVNESMKMSKRRTPATYQRDGDTFLSTGIYERAISRRVRSLQEAEQLILQESGWQNLSIEDNLQRIRGELKNIVAPYVIKVEDIQSEIQRQFPGWQAKLPLQACRAIELIPQDVTDVKFPDHLTEELMVLNLGDGVFCYRVNKNIYGYSPEAESARDALAALYEVNNIEIIQAQSDRVPFVATLMLGRMLERISVRHFEPLAATGEKVRRGGAKGAISTNADHKELHNDYQLQIDRLMKNGDPSGLSYSEALNKVAQTSGVSESTVKGHTRNRWPRKGGRPKKT